MRRVERGSSAVSEQPERPARGYRRLRCRACDKQFNERSDGLLNRTLYPSDAIALVVLRRLRYPTRSTVPSPEGQPSQWRRSRTMVRSTSANSRSPPWPSGRIGSRWNGCRNIRKAGNSHRYRRGWASLRRAELPRRSRTLRAETLLPGALK
jgi:hypothetical protein